MRVKREEKLKESSPFPPFTSLYAQNSTKTTTEVWWKTERAPEGSDHTEIQFFLEIKKKKKKKELLQTSIENQQQEIKNINRKIK